MPRNDEVNISRYGDSEKFCTIYVRGKNVHKNPFELADGETYKLPWIQIMNTHNAFLFTPAAFKKNKTCRPIRFKLLTIN